MSVLGKTPLLMIAVAALSVGGCGDAPAQKQDKVYTNETAVNQMEEDLKRNLAEVDNDPKLTPKQKEETKAMMRDTVNKRMQSFKN